MEGFKAFLTARGLAESTVAQTLSRITHARSKCDLRNPESVTAFLAAKRTCNNTLNIYVKALKLYGIYASINELQSLKLAPRNCGARATLTLEELSRFIGTTVPYKHYRTVNYPLFFKLLVLTGCRPGELIKLTAKHISWAEGCLYFINTKTRESRKVPIPNSCLIELKREANGRVGSIFPTGPVQYGEAFHYRLQQLGIDRPLLSTYSLRHSFITHQLQNPSANLFDVQSVVGHKNSQTTQQYYHLCLDRLKRVVNSHPLLNTSPEHKARLICDFIRSLGEDYEPRLTATENALKIHLVILRSRPPPQNGKPDRSGKP